MLVLVREPIAAAWLTGAAVLLAGATTRALDEDWRVFDILAVVYTLLALGLYALHLLGLSRHVVLTIAAALAGLVVAMLVRGLIAAGSADYPYDT
jgi:hypothetical protein